MLNTNYNNFIPSNIVLIQNQDRPLKIIRSLSNVHCHILKTAFFHTSVSRCCKCSFLYFVEIHFMSQNNMHVVGYLNKTAVLSKVFKLCSFIGWSCSTT